MNVWFEVLKNPTIIIPAIISVLFTLIGAFGGVYLSNKSANKISKNNRITSLKQDLHKFKLIIEELELLLPHIYSHDKIDRFTKENLYLMIKKVKEEKFITRIKEAHIPTIIESIDIENFKNSLDSLEYYINEKQDEVRVFQAYQKYKNQLMRFRIALEVVLKY